MAVFLNNSILTRRLEICSSNVVGVVSLGFVLLYVYPTFGTDRGVRRTASPLILLDPSTDTSLAGSLSMSAGAAGWSVPSLQSWSSSPPSIEKEKGLNAHAVSTCDVNFDLPPCQVFNCQFDVGLQSDGQKMTEALKKYTEVEYVYVGGADHGSICRNKTTHDKMCDFIKSKQII